MESQQPALWAILFLTFIPVAISLFFRIYGRFLTKSKLWWDDWAAIASFLSGIGRGLGLHITDIKAQTTENVLFDSKLCLYVGELIYGFTLFFAKVSVLCLYWRLFKVSSIALPIQILLGCTILWIILRTFIGIFQCTPVQYFWDTSIPGGYCAIDDRLFFIGNISVHIVTDIAVLYLPIFQLQKLNLPMIPRPGIVIIFMFGVFTSAVGVIILVISINLDLNSKDYTWVTTSIILWATVEVNLVNISANLPTVKPACYYFFKGGLPECATDRPGTCSYGLPQSKKSIMMTNMRSNHPDESSSTYQLADPIHGNSSDDFDKLAINGSTGVKTTIEGHSTKNDGVVECSDNENMNGIRVRNETVIQVSETKEAQGESPFSVADDDYV
ncbi:hypothetical protein F4809DRAFT_652463 [Biscogniauxia mediterranea]|nr:hypothetical protein F4809DRAFT_652463 [Biscogniauxia mediterranea]